MATRRKIVSPQIAEDAQSVTYNILGPALAEGEKQPVVASLTVAAADLPAARADWLKLYGLSQVLANLWNRLDDNITPEGVFAALDKLVGEIKANTWSPGRQFGEREPTDLELAIAEATGQPVSAVQDRIENEIKRNPDGSPVLDKRGRVSRVFNQRMLDAIASDPKVKPILARLVAERAKRLQQDVRKGGGNEGLLTSMFGGTAEPQAEAAE